jgi:hypothetical protein
MFIYQRAVYFSICLSFCLLSLGCSTYHTYTNLDKALNNPRAVERLKISNKNLGTLTPQIQQFRNLKELILLRVHIDSLPAEIGKLTTLEYLSVYKENLKGRTQTQVRSLDKQEKIKAIAQMISGEKITAAALQNATELLNLV